MSGSVFDASGWPMSRGSGVVSRDNKSGKAGIVPVEAVVVTPELPATPVPRREIEDSTDAGGNDPSTAPAAAEPDPASGEAHRPCTVARSPHAYMHGWVYKIIDHSRCNGLPLSCCLGRPTHS